MELRHRVLRRIALGITDRALQEIARDPQRGLRSLVDFGICTGGPSSRALLTQIKSSLAPHSHYYQWASRVVEQVDPLRLRALAQALASSLVYGAGALHQRSRQIGFPLPWCIQLDRALPVGSQLLEEAQALECHTFLLQNLTVREACATAMQAPNAFFLASFRAKQLREELINRLQNVKNLVVTVELNPGEEPLDTFQRLRDSGCLFGGHLQRDGKIVPALERGLQDRLSRAGCCFLSYLSPPGAGPEEQRRLTCYVQEDRAKGKSSLPLLLPSLDLNWVAADIAPGIPLWRASPEIPLLTQLRIRAAADRRAVF